MLAFHNKDEIKTEYLARVRAHEVADEIIHGKYWENGKGCAVGCTIHSDQHSAYETELGIPLILARLEDRIFEGMANGYSKQFPARFLSAIAVGADLSMVWPRFAVWLLVDEQHGVIRFTKKNSRQWTAIHRVAELYSNLESWDKRDKKAFRAAYATAAAAAAYATAAAYAAYAAYAAAVYATDAAAAAAAYAAAAAAAAATDAAAAANTRKKSYKTQADKLLELLAAA